MRNKLLTVLLICSTGLLNMALAQGGIAGLDEATNLIKDIFGWGKVFLIAIATVYVLYIMVQAFMERKTWSDVLVAIVWACVAGAAGIIAEWAVGYWS